MMPVTAATMAVKENEAIRNWPDVPATIVALIPDNGTTTKMKTTTVPLKPSLGRGEDARPAGRAESLTSADVILHCQIVRATWPRTSAGRELS